MKSLGVQKPDVVILADRNILAVQAGTNTLEEARQQQQQQQATTTTTTDLGLGAEDLQIGGGHTKPEDRRGAKK